MAKTDTYPLRARLHLIRKRLEPITKQGAVAGEGEDAAPYVPASDAIKHVKAELVRERVLVLPSVIDVEYVSGQGERLALVKLGMEVSHPADGHEHFTWAAEGTGDNAVAQARRSGLKSFLLDFFLVEVEEEEPPTDTRERVSPEDIERLIQPAIAAVKLSDDAVAALLEDFGLKELKDLPKSRVPAFRKAIARVGDARKKHQGRKNA